ncbi:uncharacterized protein N7477_006666 [Penicillium maclennaniae]|uniref:uncharacterized protein n=1 Tax=Penicillium maclennaniae TaxID=1343394 RepID=UPI00253FF3F0|nr:uncharacterized protein N7477_006666 [Penicillium maclennaniae]KAJ5668096.1 hypothetical protein N7477_006666 [Penicillium maclennaniae]
MEEPEKSIYRWLSRVTHGEQTPGASGAGTLSGAPYICPSLTGLAESPGYDGPAYPLESYSAVLEPTGCAPQSQWLNPRKRTRERATRQKPPRDEPCPAKPDEYERKPRPKTRKYQYEYITTGSPTRNLSEVPEPKAKRQRRSRKQSMNDGFRATNVARKRLTLTSTANLGIFRKGRASSPTKRRNVPNFAFSETILLSQNTSGNGRVSMSAVNEPKKQKEISHDYDLSSFRSCNAPKKRDLDLDIASSQSPAQYIGQFEPIDATSSLRRPSPNKITYFTGPTKMTIVAPDAKAFDSQAVEVSHYSRPATPYTWSASGRATASLGAVIQDHLLNTLHVGLFPKLQTSSEIGVGSKYYYSLHDLKMLLEARKESWRSNDNGKEATFQPAPILNPSQQLATQSPDIEEDAEGSIFNFNTAHAERSMTPGLGETRKGDALLGSQLQDDFNGNTISSLLSSQSQKMSKPPISDADAFFRALDAEFCAIMEPSNNYLEHARRSSKTEPTLEVDQDADTPLRTQITSFDDEISSLDFDQSGSGIGYSASHPIPDYHAQVELATRPINRRMLPLPFMSNDCIKKTSNHAPKASSTQPWSALTAASAVKHTTLPSGFWRQNKLY